MTVDKILHFVAGFGITLCVSLFYSPLYGMVVGIVAGVLKEVYDHIIYDGEDFFDFFATLGGVFFFLFLNGLYLEFI